MCSLMCPSLSFYCTSLLSNYGIEDWRVWKDEFEARQRAFNMPMWVEIEGGKAYIYQYCSRVDLEVEIPWFWASLALILCQQGRPIDEEKVPVQIVL